jgi:hypothetical protein
MVIEDHHHTRVFPKEADLSETSSLPSESRHPARGEA